MPATKLTEAAKATVAQYPEHLRDRVAALIPSPEIAEAYSNRTIDGVLDFDIFEAAHKTKHNVLFRGPTGSGKTTAARAYAAHLQVPFVRVEYHRQMAVESMFGKNQFRDGQTIFEPGDLWIGAQGPSVILHDEISNLNPGAFAANHGMFDASQSIFVPQTGTTIYRSPDARMFAAYNPKYAGNMELSQAGRNRFAFSLEWGYDHEMEMDRYGGASETLVKLVHKLRAEPKIVSDIGTNAIEEFITIADELGVTMATTLFVNRFDEGERWAVQNAVEAESYRIADELDLN